MLALPIRNLVVALTLAAFEMAGCTQIPSMDSPLDGPVSGRHEVYVTDIVKRVKCELYWALREHLPNKTRGFVWVPGKANRGMFDKKDPRYLLSTWDATVHLELVLNDQGTISPGVSLVQPLVNAYNIGGGPSTVPFGKPSPTFAPTVAATPQNFSFGIGGGVTSQAARTDDVQFSISMTELVGEFEYDSFKRDHYNDCTKDGHELGESAFLKSRLGLAEWIDSTLGPTLCHPDPANLAIVHEPPCKPDEFRYLTVGYHPPATAGTIPALRSLPSVVVPKNALVEELRKSLPPTENGFEQAVADYEKKLQKQEKYFKDLDYNYKNIILPAYKKNACEKVPQNGDVTYGLYRDKIKARIDAAHLDAKKAYELSQKGAFKDAIDELFEAEGQLEFEETLKEADELGRKVRFFIMNDCKGLRTASKQATPPDAPLDNLTHTVQFLVATNVNATPSWSFARVKAGTSSALAALTHNNTQTLAIVLGSPGSSKAGQNQSLADNEILKATLRQLVPGL